jgi:ribosomal protein S18 acetylase RimI-like enzyme
VPIRIYSKEAKDLTLFEEKSCAKLISSGSIYSLYVECCSTDKKVPNRVFMAKENGKIIGWSIIRLKKKIGVNGYFEFMFYIKRLYRRRGIATKMYKRSRKFFNLEDDDIKVYKTDTANIRFFDSVMES